MVYFLNPKVFLFLDRVKIDSEKVEAEWVIIWVESWALVWPWAWEAVWEAVWVGVSVGVWTKELGTGAKGN